MLRKLCWLGCALAVGCGDDFEAGGGSSTTSTSTTTTTTDTTSTGTGGGGTTTTNEGGSVPASCDPIAIADDFTSDSGAWSPQSNGEVQGELAGGVLRFSATAGATGEAAWLGSVQDVRNHCVFVEIPDSILHGATTAARFILGGPGGSLGLVVNAGSLTCIADVGTPEQACNLAHDAVAHRWLRVRAAEQLVHFEASPDAATWTSLGSIAAGPFLENLGPILSLRVPQAAPADVLVAFDNFDVAP